MFLVSGRVAKKEGWPLQLDESQTYRKEEEGDRKNRPEKPIWTGGEKEKSKAKKIRKKFFAVVLFVASKVYSVPSLPRNLVQIVRLEEKSKGPT